MIRNETTAFVGPGVLDEPTLVLNRSWLPISTTTVRHAICLVASEAAHVVEPDTYQKHDLASWCEVPVVNGDARLRTVCHVIRAPEIIVLSRYDKLPMRQVPFSRRNLYRRDQFRCQYCARRLPNDQLTIDHVVPRSRG